MWEAEDRSRPLGAGLIGGGFIAGVHARAVRAAGSPVRAVASSSPERAERAAAELGAGRACASVAELLADDTVDVVHICSPHGTHAGYARAALAAGKHVVCEKPLAVSAEEALRLTELAAEHDRVATVPFVYRYHPMAVEARARVAAGDLGRLVGVRGAYLQEWRLAYSEDGWWTDPASTGPSRAFGDIGSHLGDLLSFVCGQDITRVAAATRTVLGHSPGGRPLETEDVAAVTVETESGAIGTLMVSQMTLGRKNHLTLEVSGLDGSLVFEQENPETLWYADRSGRRPVQRDAPHLSPAAARLSVLPGGHPMGYQDAFDAFVRDTYDAVRGATPGELPYFRDGLRAALLTEAVVTSAATGAWTDVRRPADRPLEGV